jgi:D-beta-D-heptose 7-phosphate kinase/D-beta-D-heptose 1-phosphate adenosyltransferase
MKIAIVGDACKDIYVYGACDRLCPEGPVPVLNKMHQIEAGGMALNVFNNLKTFFADDVKFYSNNIYNMQKVRYVDEKTNQLLLRVDHNDTCDRITEETIQEIKDENYDAIVVSDYCKGFMIDEDLIELGNAAPISFLDSKRKLTTDIALSYNLIKLNEYEYNQNIKLVKASPKRFVITLGSKGVMFLSQRYEPPKVLQTYDVSGAGDTFLAAVVSKVMDNQGIDVAIKFAQECCNKVIQERGTCVYKKDMD